MLPMKRIYGALVMRQEPATRALVELRQIGQTPSGANPILPDAPEAFTGMEMGSAPRWPKRPPKRFVPGGPRRRPLVRPVDATAVGDHAHLLPRMATKGQHWMARLAYPLRGTMRDALRDDARGAIRYGSDDAAQHAAGATAPGALRHPCLAFAGCLAVALTLAQRARGEARARHLAPPARPGEGKAPQDRFIFLEPDARATAGPVREGSECARRPRQLSRVGSEPARGPAGASLFVFHPARTLSRLSWTPVGRPRLGARA